MGQIPRRLFRSEALWTYLTSPLRYIYPGFESEEIEPWHEDGEEWRRLKVTFPGHIASHTRTLRDELAQERRRFGYRRLHVLLRRECQMVNKKRVQRIYREERLTMRRRGGRKRAIGTRRPMETPHMATRR